MKTIFLALFLISILVFIPFYYLNIILIYVGAMHFAILSLALYLLYDKDLKAFLKRIGFPGSLKTNFLYTFGGLIATVLVLLILSSAFELIGMNDQDQVAKVAKSLPLFVLAIAVFFAPLSEELFFRAYLSSRFGVFISSLIFGLIHFAYGSIVEMAGAFAIGIVLAIVYKRSGSIIPPILIHMIYNFFSIIVLRWVM